MVLKFEENIIPAIAAKTLGNLTFISKEEKAEYNKENQRTGAIAEIEVDVSSDYQESAITIVVPPEAAVHLEGLKFGDVVEVEEPVFRAWAMIPEDSNSNFADSDVKVRAKSIKKKGGLRQNLNPNNSTNTTKETAADKK